MMPLVMNPIALKETFVEALDIWALGVWWLGPLLDALAALKA